MPSSGRPLPASEKPSEPRSKKSDTSSSERKTDERRRQFSSDLVANGAFADIGPAVARLGVPVPEILDEYEALRSAVDGVAERFRTVFEQYLWQPFVDCGMPADEVPALTADVGKLTELATSVVAAELSDRFAAFAEDYLAKAADG